MTKEYLIKLFGKEWYEALDFSEKDIKLLQKTGNYISHLRKFYKIYPSSDLVFRAFKETPYSEVKVILLGTNPYYNNDNEADGLAYSASMALYAPQAVEILLNEVNIEYPEWKNSIEYGRLGWIDLKRWANQGVFLYNTYLTVQQKKPDSHAFLWDFLIQLVFKALSKKNDLVWILLGKDAQSFSKLITNITHTVLTAPHPTVELYNSNVKFYNCNIFRKTNEELQARNKSIIYW